MPLGTFAVIEGTEHSTGKLSGSDDFFIESINGIKVEHDLRIMTEWPSQLPDKRIAGKRYVLHGYERGKWEGQPDGLPKNEPLGWTQQAGFSFQHMFAVTSVEKIDGVTVADARPLDPKVPLAKPNFEAKRDDKRPVGALGLPLGTFAIIQARTPVRPIMIGSPFEIVNVNGKPLKNPQILTIYGVPDAKGNELITLRGFETGAWASEPDLPKSETGRSSSSPLVQTPFRFFAEFVPTTPVKSGR